MAKPPAKTQGAAKKDTGGVGIMGLLRVVGFALTLVAVVLLVGGMHDLLVVDLTPFLAPAILPALVMILAGASLMLVGGNKIAAVDRQAAEDRATAVRAEVEERLAAVEARIDAFIAEEHKRLKAENDQYRKEVELHRAAEAKKVAEELHALREQNFDLQDQIKKWAVNSVESAIANGRIHAS